MAMTLRLPEDFAVRGRRYATELGISLNGLVAIALREYLDRKQQGEARAAAAPHSLVQAIASQVKAGPVRRRR